MASWIVYTGIRLLLLIHPFISSFFFLSNFQTLKYIVALFSGTVRPRRLKRGTHVDSGQMYHVHRNQAAAAYSSLLISSFFFLSSFQTLNFFVTLFSGTVRPRRLKLDTHVDSGQMYHVYLKEDVALIRPFISSFSFLSNFQALKIFIGVFLGTVKPRKLKLRTNMNSGWMYCVYRNEFAAACSSLQFFIYHSLQFSNIKNFVNFSQELWVLQS